MTAVTADSPGIRIAGRDIPIVLPRRSDPRLKLSAVIMTLQLLGQTVLDFKLSISQILVSIAVCAVIEVAVTFRRESILAWPASAILTGNSVAFILRASGTEHGDWWSLHGVEYFVLAAVLSMLSKHLIRPYGGRHLFNPSNVGIVWTLLVIGPAHVFPQYLWWGPSQIGQALAYGVIAAGALWVLPKVRMGLMAASFLGTLAVLVAVLAAAGRTFVAIWHEGAISGAEYWVNIALSPEVLIFVFFMMSDPQTAPKQRVGRIAYGAGTAAIASLLIAIQTTEFGIKLSILASLTIVCALVPLLEQLSTGWRPRLSAAAMRRVRRAVATPAVVAAGVIAVAAPLNTAALADNEELILIERGLAGRNAQ